MVSVEVRSASTPGVGLSGDGARDSLWRTLISRPRTPRSSRSTSSVGENRVPVERPVLALEGCRLSATTKLSIFLQSVNLGIFIPIFSKRFSNQYNLTKTTNVLINIGVVIKGTIYITIC